VIDVVIIGILVGFIHSFQNINAYLDYNNLLPFCQSGFRKGHSPVPLLLHLLSDICGAMDKTQLTLLALFDASAAFDSLDHDLLLRRLSITFGINELPLAWITSYLSERSASVLFHSSRSLGAILLLAYLRDTSLGLFCTF